MTEMAPQRAPATAFTVNFDSPSEEVSLQDAARKSAQARRILNRRSGAHRAGAAELPPSNPSNKRYLINKLLQGEEQNAEEAGGVEGSEVEERKEADVASETGTYVVGKLILSLLLDILDHFSV
ncbi:unnamed protein product [Strongylus vulgaris]|uniref:Uncharacterized protein n=1 Tax=Strongylus vulgaris TaxID=40348 RepID=A0A3P7K015_STRVU|nr:unnamed protein product [Strongylus vulgaris]